MTTTLTSQPREQSSSSLFSQATEARFWRGSAPEKIASEAQWKTWSRHLLKRRSPKSLAPLCDASESPLRWGLSLEHFSQQGLQLLDLHDQIGEPRKQKALVSDKTALQFLTAWQQGTKALPQSLDFALESLAVVHLLPLVVGEVSEETWWELLDALLRIATSASDWQVDAEYPPEQALAQQLLSGELQLTLAYLFPEIRPLHKLRSAAHETLSAGLVELTNGQGLLRGHHLSVCRPLLACWTRCRAMGEHLKQGSWNKKAEKQFQWLMTQSLALSASDGSAILGAPNSESWTADFLKTALVLGGSAADETAARAIFTKSLTRNLSGKKDDSVPKTSDHCEWAGVAVMRTDWDRKAPAMVVDYSAPDLRMELWSGTQRIVSGAWEWETSVDGKQLEPEGDWEESCWFSDEDVDYLELVMELAGGARLERQILLAREEQFLLLADYVHDTGGGDIKHCFRLPLEDTLRFAPEKETREALLLSKKPVARILPLALPEWRTDPRIGELTCDEGQLQLKQQRQGNNLACPLLFDLHALRAKKQCTWRQLTVAQALEIQPHDVAVGFRAQCGKQQWLFYRSLEKAMNRTVLGHNLSIECLVARFLAPSGEIDELLEIEG